MAHIGVSVNDSTKVEWEEFIEKTNYGSMSELVRSAVRREIRQQGENGGPGVPREVEKQLSQVAETQTTLERQMNELADGFEDVAASTDTQYPNQVVELGHDIAGDLEEIHVDWFKEAEVEARDELRVLADDHLNDPGRIGEVADALDYLEDNLSYVQTTPLAPSDYYRVRGGR